MHIPYEQVRKYRPDFKVKYSFFLPEDGGRMKLPFQGIRCDFAYEGDDISKTGINMIHPEFLDESGQVILDNSVPVRREGTAYMWILLPEMRRTIHQKRINVGAKGFFQEGSKRTATLEVIEVIGLHENPVA
jgi:hypothetical protein